MAKETKIGLAVIGLLLLVFSGLLVRRLQTPGKTGPSPESALTQGAHGASPALADQRASVVVAQKNAPDHAPVSLSQNAWSQDEHSAAEASGDAAINRGFMPPAEPAETKSRDRYDTAPAEEPTTAPLEPDTIAPGPNAESADPQPSVAEEAASPPVSFDAGDAPAPVADSDEQTTTVAPLALPVADTAPPAGNPLRRTSAAEPVDASAVAPTDSEESAVETADETAAEAGGLPTEPPAEEFDDRASTPTRDPRVSPAADERVAVEEAPQPADPPGRNEWREGGAPAEPLPPAEPITPPADGKYVVQPNDNLWIISEKVYGTGGYFKALHEFNRARLPRANSLVVGSVLMVPPVTTLEQNFPSLCPKQRKSAVVRARTLPASTRGRRAGDDVYVVAQGDTLFDIARYELGKASRWAEIYELNRDVLGEDFDYLRPGLELTLPSKGRATDSFTRQDDSRLQR